MASLIPKRAFSVTSIAAQTVRPPVMVHGIEGRYAAALYSAAYKQKKLEAVEGDLKKIKQIYDSDKKFQVDFSISFRPSYNFRLSSLTRR